MPIRGHNARIRWPGPTVSAYVAALVAGLLLAGILAVPSTAAAVQWAFSCETNGKGQAVKQTFSPPTGVDGLRVVAVGGGGSPGKASPSQTDGPGGAAGTGGVVIGDVPVQTGETID